MHFILTGKKEHMLKISWYLWFPTEIQQVRERINVHSSSNHSAALINKSRIFAHKTKWRQLYKCVLKGYESCQNKQHVEMMPGKCEHRNSNVRKDEVFSEEVEKLKHLLRAGPAVIGKVVEGVMCLTHSTE